MKERYPALFKQMVDEPRFVPTGGTWVEMDCNIPSGESFIRMSSLHPRLHNVGFHLQEFHLLFHLIEMVPRAPPKILDIDFWVVRSVFVWSKIL